MSYAQIEITEVGPAEYPLIRVLRDTIFGEFNHRYANTFDEAVALLETTGFPANRPRSRTPTSTAKMTAPAAAMVAGGSGFEPAEPCVSTAIETPARAAAASSASAAM